MECLFQPERPADGSAVFRSETCCKGCGYRIAGSLAGVRRILKAVAAMTPMQYQKQLRLHEARRLMLVQQLDVGQAGYRVGYQRQSQFSREYSRLYGLPPLRDVDRLRASSMPG